MQEQYEYIYLFISAEIRGKMNELSVSEADLRKAIFSLESDDKVSEKKNAPDIHIGSFEKDGKTISVEYSSELDQFLNMGSIFTINDISVSEEVFGIMNRSHRLMEDRFDL